MSELSPIISSFVEKAEPLEEPQKFTPKIYRARFEKVQAYKLLDDSRIHCADGTILNGRGGDYYVCLDNCVEMILDPTLFKRLFILSDLEN